MDGLQALRYFLLHPARHLGENVAVEVHDASLETGLGEALLGRGAESQVGVGDLAGQIWHEKAASSANLFVNTRG